MSESETNKSKIVVLNDYLSQLKEMKHYAQSNIEKLSAQWLAFDQGEYQDKTKSENINKIISKQSDCLDEICLVIEDFEIQINKDSD